MDVLFLLEKLYRDPLVLSKFSQFRSYTVNEGESISNLNENQEFQICFVLKGTLRFSNNQANSMPKLITKNELFFISHFHECNIKANAGKKASADTPGKYLSEAPSPSKYHPDIPVPAYRNKAL